MLLCLMLKNFCPYNTLATRINVVGERGIHTVTLHALRQSLVVCHLKGENKM